MRHIVCTLILIVVASLVASTTQSCIGNQGNTETSNLVDTETLLYTQADMNSVLEEVATLSDALDTCLNNKRRCPICPSSIYTCPPQEECTPSYFGPEVCAYACTVEKYSCIYKCWEATDGYKCTEICQGEYNTCQSSCG